MEMEDIEKWKGQLLMFTDQLRKKIEQIPETQLYVAAAVTTITLLLSFLVHLFKRKKLNTIVLAGVSGGGKTVLFYQLRDGSSHQGTVTSMDPNEDTCLLHSETSKGKLKPVHLVDVPGHSRLRPKLDEYLPQAAGLIFMVDAVEFLHSCRQVAEYLYDILTKASVVKGRVPILILCNKTEKVSAHSKDFIRKQLEKEIDKLRTSRSSVSEADVTNEYTLGSPGQAFAFSHCINKVTVAEASALTVNGDCSYTSCGENMYPKNKITFPFRAYDQPMSCGLPGFDLGCNLSNRTPLLTFPSGQSFTVEGIYNYYLKKITISDPQGCLPEKLLHLNTSGTPFFFEKLANFTLYKCPSRIPSPHPACRGIYCTNGPPYSVLCSDNNSSIDGCELVGDVRVPNSSYYLTYYRSYEFTSASTAYLTWDMTSCRRSPKDFTKVKCNHLTSGDMAIIMTATLLLIVIVGISYVICKCRKRTSSRGATTSTPTEQHGTSASAGVAQGTLEAYPIMVVGESGRMLTNMDDKSCVICLSEYAPKDALKMLPECLHSFHVVCIDEWLRANATCPICRTQPPLRP